jgi:hypothetical protein
VTAGTTDTLTKALDVLIDRGGLLGALFVIFVIGGSTLLWRMQKAVQQAQAMTSAVQDERVKDAREFADTVVELAKQQIGVARDIVNGNEQIQNTLEGLTAAMRDMRNQGKR